MLHKLQRGGGRKTRLLFFLKILKDEKRTGKMERRMERRVAGLKLV